MTNVKWQINAKIQISNSLISHLSLVIWNSFDIFHSAFVIRWSYSSRSFHPIVKRWGVRMTKFSRFTYKKAKISSLVTSQNKKVVYFCSTLHQTKWNIFSFYPWHLLKNVVKRRDIFHGYWCIKCASHFL